MNSDDLVLDFRASLQPDGYGDDVWSTIIDHLVGRLSNTLGQRGLSVDEGGLILRDGFTVDFRSNGSGQKPWQLALRGILGAQVIEDVLLVRAWIFPYFRNERLIAKNLGDAALLKYVRQEHGGAWISYGDGWEFEEGDDFADFAHFEGG